MNKIRHMSCLGALCNEEIPHYTISGISKEEYFSNFTMRPNEVTCPKCIEILKNTKILRQ